MDQYRYIDLMRHTNSLIQPLHPPYTGKEKKGKHNVQVFKFA